MFGFLFIFFTCQGGDDWCCDKGQRVPAVVTRNSYRYFRTSMAIGNSGDKKVDSDFSAITLHNWHSFEIKQWHDEDDNRVD